MAQEPAGSSSSGAQGPKSRGQSPRRLAEGNEQSRQEETRFAGVPDSETGNYDHGQRNHQSTPLSGKPGDHGEQAPAGNRRDGIRQVCSTDLPGSPGTTPRLHWAVPPDIPRGDHLLADDPLSQVDRPAEGDREDKRHEEGIPNHEQWGNSEGESLPPSSPHRRALIFQFHRRDIRQDPHGHLLIRTGGGRDGGTARSPDPRTPTSKGDGQQELIQEGRRTGQDPQEGTGDGVRRVREDQSRAHLTSEYGGEIHDLGEHHKKDILFGLSRGFESDWCQVAYGDRLRLLEVCCDPESELSNTCNRVFGDGSARRLSAYNGGDVETKAGTQHIIRVMKETRPGLVWLSPECGPFSPMQHLNMKTEKQRQDLAEKRARARQQYKGCCEIAEEAHKENIPFIIELSERCEGWNETPFSILQNRVPCVSGVCKGCQVGLRNEQRELLGKGWRLLGTAKGIIHHMTLKCSGDHVHGKCEGQKRCRQTAFYTPTFCKRVVNVMKRDDLCKHVTQELKDGMNLFGDMNMSNGHDNSNQVQKGIEEAFSMSPDRKSSVLRVLRRIHAATGHCSRDYLVKALKRRNADHETIELAKNFRCSTCEEHVVSKPRVQGSLEDIPPKWARVQVDGGSWSHPETKENFHFLLGIDEGSRFRRGMILKPGKKISMSGEDLITFLEEYWKPVFGNPACIRMDPAGPFRSERLDQYLLNQKIVNEQIPAEAHWKIPHVERAIQTTKNMMSKLASECPEMSCREVFCRSLWAQNSRDQYLGFSPLQHVLGRNPCEDGCIHDRGCDEVPLITERGVTAEFGEDNKAMKIAEESFIEEQYKHRLSRAQASGSRVQNTYKPGDLVLYWRKQLAGHGHEVKGQGFKKGGFIGPARVLATETKLSETGERTPGQNIWIFRGTKLLKATPQLLRHASEREEAWAELKEDQPLPWTVTSILEQSKNKTFEDLTKVEPPLDWEEDDDPEIIPDQPGAPPPPRFRHRRKGPEPEQPPAKHHRREALDQQMTEGDESLIALASETPATFLEDEHGSIQIAIDMPDKANRKKKHWLRDLAAFVISQSRKNHVEVSERRLSPTELEQFRQAKQKEVKNYILAEVFKKIPDHMKPDASQVLKMRWILTWKCDKENPDQKKAKARAVILGYQDPLYETRPTASPTMNKSTRQLFLTLCAAHHFRVEKGDISGAFLQGREFQDQLFIEPLKEIAEAMNLPEGSITRLAKAAYGLVQAPLEFYLSVDEFLEQQGFIRQKADPCCWGLFDQSQSPIAWICSHVDDFLFGGDETDLRWQHVKSAITTRFKFGEWEKGKFVQCGVNIEQREDFSFKVSQPEFLEQVSEIYIPKQRSKDLEASASPEEQKQMRSVLGCLAWHAGQLAMELSAPTGLLLSKVPKAQVTDLLEANKLLKKAKARQGQCMIIHTLNKDDLMLTTWVDAAYGNRPDLSSTKGVLIGCTDSRILQGELSQVNPIFWCSSKISRVCRSSASAETRAAVDGEDQMYALRFQMAEFLGHHGNEWSPDETVNKVPGALVSDSRNLYDRLSSTILTLGGAEKRSDIETLCLKEALNANQVHLRWVNGESQLSNSLTKDNEPHQIHMFNERSGRWRIVYDESLVSGRKRKQDGKGPLD